jgi:hypothetical protein
MNLDKLQRAEGLSKETRQSDHLGDAAGRAMQTIREAIVEYSGDESLQVALSRFMRAWSEYNSATDKSKAAAAFALEVNEITRQRQLGRAVRSSLAKSPFDFWNR